MTREDVEGVAKNWAVVARIAQDDGQEVSS